MFKYRQLFFMPSFYMLATFSLSYLMYVGGIIAWEQPPAELHFWCSITILFSLLSIVIHFNNYKLAINRNDFSSNVNHNYLKGDVQWVIFIGINIIGLLVVVKYILDYSNYLGQFGIFITLFTEHTGQLRTLSENVESSGTQISYFSWIAAFILTTQISSKKISKWWILWLALIVLLNSIFLDRTRPVWIIFTCALCYFLVRYNLYSRKKIISVIGGIAAFFVTLFIAIGTLLGKGADEENYLTVDLPKWVQPIFLYFTSSFAYLGRLLYDNNSCDYSLSRITYPLQKYLQK
jgi:hypothetical protein